MAAPRRTVLTEGQLMTVEYLILNRFKKPNNKVIGEALGIKAQTINSWRKMELFQEELDRKTALYKGNFEDVQLADRKERVVVLQKLFDRLPEDSSTSMKLKIIQEIRQETGGNAPIQVEMHHSLGHGPEIPPRAGDYDEWCAQNKKMLAVEAEYVEMERSHGKEKEREGIRQGIIPEVTQGKVSGQGNGSIN
jgi:hypothetical protein